MKSIIKYGGYSSLSIIVLFAISLLLLGTGSENFDISEIVGYLSIVASLVFVFIGMRDYKNNHPAEPLSFLKGLKVGMLIALFPAVVFGLYNVLYIEVIDPEFTENYYNHSLEQMKATMSEKEFKITKADLDQQQAIFTNPLAQFFIMFITVVLFGFIVSIISAMVLSNKKVEQGEG